jgi:hypothetical protein
VPELFSLFLELLGDLLLQLLGGAIFDLALRTFGRFFKDPEFDPVAVSGIYFALGAFAGGFSLLIFPHAVVRPSRVPGISLLISPTVTGAIMSLIGFILRRKGKRAVQLEAFWYGFALAFGMALVRFLFAA